MRFLTVDNFIKEILEIYPKTTDVYVAYDTLDSKDDMFGKKTSYPLLIVLLNGDTKKVMKYEEIIDFFEGKIALTLSKPRIITKGIACYKISTTMEHSEKFNIDFFPRKSVEVSDNVFNLIKNTKKEYAKMVVPEVLDI